jgi:hypothetical protein
MPTIVISLILLITAAATTIVIISPWEAQEASQEDIANQTDPLTSLEATIASSQWGQTFWAKQAQAQTPLWDEANTYCAEDAHKDLPNCGFVNLAAFLNQPRKPVPEYGTSPSAVSTLPEIKAPQ